CSKSSEHSPAQSEIITHAIETTALDGSRVSRVGVSPNGKFYLSWIEKGPERSHSLKLAFFENHKWSAPSTIAAGRGWMVNWADFQSVVADAEGNMAAQWLETIEDTRNYGVKVSVSSDAGKTWGSPFWLHSDLKSSEHGFVSIVPESKGVFRACWLDARSHESKGNMELLSARFSAAGRLGEEHQIDARVCDCCATSTALANGTPVIAYRDRSTKEIRDISLSRFEDGNWSKPLSVYPDNWLIPG
ncbi:MAG: hypothetical protein ACI97A_003701, partial [Planctomycetota bacterium]